MEDHLTEFISMCKRFGLEPKVFLDDGFTRITFEEGDPNVAGYSGFFCTFVFDSSSRFVGIDIGE